MARCRCHSSDLYDTLDPCPSCGHWSFDPIADACERRKCGYEGEPMNTAKIATALNTISVAFGELAEALNETSSTGTLDQGRGMADASPSGSPAPTFSDGKPVEEPPLFPGAFEGEEADPRPAPSFADESTEFRPPAQTERDRVLGECPVHQVRWTIKPGGVSAKTGQPYSSFWKCAEKNPDDSYCSKKPIKDWIKTHDPEKALAAA